MGHCSRKWGCGLACTFRVWHVGLVLGRGVLCLCSRLTTSSCRPCGPGWPKRHAYSLVAPDEVPYLLDLHLFLGRALTLARPHEEPSGEWRLGRGWGPPWSSWYGWGSEVGQAVLAWELDPRGRSLFVCLFKFIYFIHLFSAALSDNFLSDL